MVASRTGGLLALAVVAVVLGACIPAPPPVPPPLSPESGATGAMVRFASVEGYLARPIASHTEACAALWVGQFARAPVQEAALQAAGADGCAVLVVTQAHAQARAYLADLFPSPLPLHTCVVACAEDGSCAYTVR